MMNLLCLCSVPATPPLCLPNPPFGNPLPLSYKTLVFLMSNSDLLNLALGGGSLCTQIKKLAFIACFN